MDRADLQQSTLGVVLLALLVLVSARDSTAQLASGAAGQTGTTPTIELPSDDCFGRFLVDQMFCKAIHCEDLWFLVWEWNSCDDEGLEQCLADARAGLEECLGGRGS